MSLSFLLGIAGTGPMTVRAGFIQALGSVPGKTESGVPRLSADGSVAVGYVGPTTATRGAFRWTSSTGMSPVPFPNSPQPAVGRGLGVSGDGSVVVGYYNENGTISFTDAYPFAYSTVTGISTRLDPPGGQPFHGQAEDASANGSVIVGQINFLAGFRYTPQGGAVPLTHPTSGAQLSPAHAISPDGSIIVGGFAGSGGYRLSSAGGYISFNFEAVDLTPQGDVITGSRRIQIGNLLTEEGIRWTQSGGEQILGDLPGGDYRCIPDAISADGRIIVGASDAGNTFDAFIWDAASGIRELKQVLANEYGINTTGWRLSEATSISADGTVIAGSGWDPSGKATAWVAVIPEPTSTMPLPLLAAFLAATSRGRPPRFARLARAVVSC